MDTVYNNIATNLEIKDKKDLEFPFLDYGYLYGYGLFESIRVINGQPLLIDEHIQRLKRGSIILDIPFKWENEDIKKKSFDIRRWKWYFPVFLVCGCGIR